VKTEPRELVEQVEAAASLAPGLDERFNGYGVMGLPFQSGHVLAMRRFTASSIGPAYSSIWHRDPTGEWVFYSNVTPRQACTRFFGAIASDAIETEISVGWSAPFHLRVTMPAMRFDWEIEVGATVATRLMNAVGRLLPQVAWRSPAVLDGMSVVAGALLGVGRIGLHGRVPNGQHFIANPRVLWSVVESQARLAGTDFGPPGPVQPQAHLGDFWIPQRGMFALGQAYFDAFDPAVHSAKSSRSASADDL
jgi:hypothetical protein